MTGRRSKDFEYGITIKNILACDHINSVQRTILLGTIVKIEKITSNCLLVKLLVDDGETWESAKYVVDENSVTFISKDIWPFLAAVCSPQERLKLGHDNIRATRLMQLCVGSTVGYLNFETVVLATVKYIGKIKQLGKGFGLQLHEANPNSSCDGMHGGLRYFQCPHGCAVFTTIERVKLYGNASFDNIPVLPNIDINGMLEKNLECFSINNRKDCDEKMLSNKTTTNTNIQVVYKDPVQKESVTSYSKLYGNVKTSSSLEEILQKTTNQNNEFDHNTIIQADSLRLMQNDLRSRDKEHKQEIDLVDVIGSQWAVNSHKDEDRTLKKRTDKPHKSVFYTTCPEFYSNQPRNKSTNIINHLVNSKTAQKGIRPLPVENSNSFKDENETVLDRKKSEINIQINRTSCEEKNHSTLSVLYTTPKAGTTKDFTIGSLVEILNDVSPHPLYGVVRWLGVELATEEVLVGVELEEEHSQLPLTLTDGTHKGQRYFKCSKNKGIFVPLNQCHKDSRFSDGASVVFESVPEETFGNEMESPVIRGLVSPLCMPTEEDVEAVCGKFRGIQGHHNSCYLDATLFAMFTFTSVFDTLLYRPKRCDDSVCYEKVQQVLREEIVNPLRTNLFVRADRIMNLRKLLDQLSSVSGLTTEEKDPEEFLHSLLAQILKAEPFLKLSSGQEAYHYQLFLEKEDHLTLPSVQHLFEQSFLASNIKLKEVPSCLIIQMPRFGKNYKMYPRILPSQLLDVTDVIENTPRQCTVCGNLATWECTQCFGQCGVGLESTAFCTPCLEKAHAHNKRSMHSPKQLSVSPDFLIMADHCTPPRLFMELFAVICIETSHYVAFVKCGVGHEAPWCFFDSMADRQGGQNGYNIPEMSACPDVSKWLSDEQSCRLLHENAPSDKYLPEYARRLLCDAYICMYQSPDVMMYR